MGKTAKFDDERHIRNRMKQAEFYKKSRGKTHKLRYLMKVNDIPKEEIEGLETFDEKIEYCQLVHIKNKYGITITDIDDSTTVATVHE